MGTIQRRNKEDCQELLTTGTGDVSIPQSLFDKTDNWQFQIIQYCTSSEVESVLSIHGGLVPGPSPQHTKSYVCLSPLYKMMQYFHMTYA